MPRDFSSMNITVMGLGRFGGGVGVTRWLVEQGADVLLTDTATPDALQDSLEKLRDLPPGSVTTRLGEHNISDFTTCDLVVVNPAVNPETNRFTRAATAAGIPLTSEIRLLIEHLPDPRNVIAITGTAGKSTTTAMLGHVLKQLEQHPVHIGGNLGGSLLPRLHDIGPDDRVVLELSSFMLDGLREDQWSPAIAVITNFSDNHLDWHGTLDAYRRAKQTMLDFQQPGDHALLGPDVADWPVRPQVHRTLVEAPDSTRTMTLTALPGRHNQHNAAFVLAIAKLLGHGPAQVLETLSTFAGLPHRLQRVAEHEDVRFFNDSKSTTPQAAMLALQAFEDDKTHVHLICGGYDKGHDLKELAVHASQRCRVIYTLGATGASLAQTARDADGRADVVECGDLETAVVETLKRVCRGDVVLLSPGCASWDQFENYERRGEAFVEAILRWTSEGGVIPRSRGDDALQ